MRTPASPAAGAPDAPRPPYRPLIVLIEDETDLAAMSSACLQHEGFRVLHAADGRVGLAQAGRGDVDLVVLDLGLPDGNGLEVLRSLRRTSHVPVIIVTGRGGETDRVIGLELGADDYVVKPFFQRELASRIRAVLRRVRPAEPDPVIRIGELSVDTDARQAHADGVSLDLAPREYALLEFLASAPGRTFSPEQLLDQVWQAGPGWQVPSTVAEHVYRLRRKLSARGVTTPRITTVRGYGYRLDG
ncbi:DNA-binding response regulator [Planobispora takensis]|uniref:DNA-binding response regulator n=1 Tax=Planobispora takensis TaxID=1367882 RepID=A0A8J3T2Q2_9ACTN|nr:DNA-binding response regulator [Planobispora takensis]